MPFDESQPRDQLSRFMALILRHRADQFGLQLDAQGYVHVDRLLKAIHSSSRWRRITLEDILDLVRHQEKPRFEIQGDRIRARYGHSLPFPIEYQRVDPPEYLYRGTSPASLDRIRVEGLLPMERQYVHLSANREDAYQIGLRRNRHPIVLRIRAREAHQVGVPFYQAEEHIYLVRKLPKQFIDIIDETAEPQPLTAS